jgi:haloalkane dehalogenase
MFHANPGAIILPPAVEMIKQSYKNLKTVDIGPGVHYIMKDNPHLIGEEIAVWYRTL